MTALPKLIASDLDGTLVRRDGTISPRTAAALARANSAGITIVLVTGRPVRWIPPVYAQLGASYTAVCANGAAVYDPGSDRVILERTLSAAEVRDACAAVRATVPDVTFAVETDGSRHILYEDRFPLRDDGNATAKRIATIAEMAASSPVKLLARVNGWDPDELTAAVAVAVGPGINATHSSPHGLVELSAPGVDKATGLAAYAATLGLGPADALVFGDMPNDVPMLGWAKDGGGRAVAVRNAHPLVHAAATGTTGSNDDDGVAACVESLLENGS